MPDPLIELCDVTEEGESIRQALQGEGFAVRRIDLDDVPMTGADMVVLAGDVEGALGALKLLRDDGLRGDAPVILIGVPRGTDPRGEGEAGFGADAVFRRPVEHEALLTLCHELLDASSERGSSELSGVSLAPVERTMNLSNEDEPDSSQVLIVRTFDEDEDDENALRDWAPREPTLQLGDDAPEISGVQPGRAIPESDRPSTGVRSGTPSTLGAPVEEIPRERRASLSSWLEQLFVAADRRAFPDHEPLALHLPAADERPEELVPAELLEAAPSFRIDELMIEDPIDAFTYVGGPAIPPAVSAPSSDPDVERASRPERGGEHTTAAEASESGLPSSISASVAPPMPSTTDAPPDSSRDDILDEPEDDEPGSGVHAMPMYAPAPARAEWPEDDTVLGRASADGRRQGVLGPGGALRLLFRVSSLGLDAHVSLDPKDGVPLRLTFIMGELRAVEGPVALHAVGSLRRRGRATERPADEKGADAVLQRHVASGWLLRFERDRLLREAREALLVDLVGADRAKFELRRLEDTEPGQNPARRRVLSRPIRAALVDAARDALPEARVDELLGKDRGLALGPDRDHVFQATGLPSELIDLITRLEGSSLSDFISAAPTEPGLAGVLYALVAGDLLVLTELSEPPREKEPDRSAVTHLVDTASTLAEDGDYFAILGIAPTASGGEVERAYRARRSELVALPLAPLGLLRLESRRAEAVDALDEAHAVLANTELRLAYAAALQ